MSRRCLNTARVRTLVFVCACVAVIVPASATTVIPVTDDEMVRRASHIIEGVVKRVESKWNADKSQIHTFIDIDLVKQIKGEFAKDQVEIQLRVLGGTVGDITMVIVDAPSFDLNEKVLLFLRPNFDHWLFPVVGFNQGKLRIETDPKTAKEIIPERNRTKDDFIADISAKVRQQSPKPEKQTGNQKSEG